MYGESRAYERRLENVELPNPGTASRGKVRKIVSIW